MPIIEAARSGVCKIGIPEWPSYYLDEWLPITLDRGGGRAANTPLVCKPIGGVDVVRIGDQSLWRLGSQP